MSKFTGADIKRAIRAVEAAGKTIAAVDFPKEGGFRLLLGEPCAQGQPVDDEPNPWDSVL